ALTGGGDGLRLWDPTTGQERASLGTAKIGAAVFGPDGKWIVAGYSFEQAIGVWDVASGKELRRFEGDPGEVEFLGLLPGGKEVVSMCRYHTTREPGRTIQRGEKYLRVWDLATGKETRLVTTGGMTRATSSPDGRLLAGGGRKIGVWVAASGRERVWL